MMYLQGTFEGHQVQHQYHHHHHQQEDPTEAYSTGIQHGAVNRFKINEKNKDILVKFKYH